jgi:hypothetical protein
MTKITPNPMLPPWPDPSRVYSPFGLGLQVIYDKDLGDWHWTKRPHTRRRQLIRKWQKTGKYFVPNPSVYVVAGRFIVGHPETIRKMVTAIEMQQSGAA